MIPNLDFEAHLLKNFKVDLMSSFIKRERGINFVKKCLSQQSSGSQQTISKAAINKSSFGVSGDETAFQESEITILETFIMRLHAYMVLGSIQALYGKVICKVICTM